MNGLQNGKVTTHLGYFYCLFLFQVYHHFSVCQQIKKLLKRIKVYTTDTYQCICLPAILDLVLLQISYQLTGIGSSWKLYASQKKITKHGDLCVCVFLRMCAYRKAFSNSLYSGVTKRKDLALSEK